MVCRFTHYNWIEVIGMYMVGDTRYDVLLSMKRSGNNWIINRSHIIPIDDKHGTTNIRQARIAIEDEAQRLASLLKDSEEEKIIFEDSKQRVLNHILEEIANTKARLKMLNDSYKVIEEEDNNFERIAKIDNNIFGY